MVFDLFLYSVTVQAKNYIQMRMPTEVSKIHQIQMRFANTTGTSSVIHEDSDALAKGGLDNCVAV